LRCLAAACKRKGTVVITRPRITLVSGIEDSGAAEGSAVGFGSTLRS